jgi:predicted RNase H-like HicB family nuclease
MLTAYIHAAMHHEHYELLPDNEGFYGEVEDLPGVWAQAPTLELCREELQSVLEGWLLLGLRLGHSLPIIDAIDLNVQQEVV